MTTPAAMACSAASGGLTMACLAPFGINPPDMFCGLLGVIVVQTLLRPKGHRTFWSVLGAAVGGVVLASLGGSLAAPYVLEVGGIWLSKVPPENLRAALAAVIGGFAQRIIETIRDRIDARRGGHPTKPEAKDADA
jgi:hypothetical protein